jgi:hypothetical protein
VEATWLLRRVREQTGIVRCFFSWTAFNQADAGIFFWEAFVSGASKAESHCGDAALAVLAFEEAVTHGFHANNDGVPVLSLIGAALLRAGWSSDVGVLSETCMVVKP